MKVSNAFSFNPKVSTQFYDQSGDYPAHRVAASEAESVQPISNFLLSMRGMFGSALKLAANTVTAPVALTGLSWRYLMNLGVRLPVRIAVGITDFATEAPGYATTRASAKIRSKIYNVSNKYLSGPEPQPQAQAA